MRKRPVLASLILAGLLLSPAVVAAPAAGQAEGTIRAVDAGTVILTARGRQ